VARQLRSLGFDAAALAGGYAAWQATQAVAPKAPALTPEKRIR